jgi:exodeoxyribonuclease V alpha subunit
MLSRNLVYTGITRGKKLVIVVASAAAISLGIKGGSDTRRYTRLTERLSPPPAPSNAPRARFPPLSSI